jgi:hypothetical protein
LKPGVVSYTDGIVVEVEQESQGRRTMSRCQCRRDMVGERGFAKNGRKGQDHAEQVTMA